VPTPSRRREELGSSTTGRRSFLAGALALVVVGATVRGGGSPAELSASSVATAGLVPSAGSALPGSGPVVASSSHPTVAAALASTPAGGTLVVDRSESVAASLVIDRPTTVVFRSPATLTSTVDGTVFDVRSSDVRIVDADLRGTGALHAGAGRGIVVTGTAASPLERVSIEGARLSSFSRTAVLVTNVSRLDVVGCTIADVGYAGVLLVSCADSVVRGCTVSDVHQPAGFVNSYGIAVTRDEARSLRDSPRSVRVTVEDNTVRGVPRWEGIDTHAGESILIRRNHVTGCRVGIAIVPAGGSATPKEYVFAPRDVVVTGNHVERGVAPDAGAGIVVRGAGSTVGSSAERATAVVEGNLVVGMGGGDHDGGIVLYLTRGVVVRGNTLRDCVRRGVALYHSNDAALVADNVVDGLAALDAGEGPRAAFQVLSAANTATFVANAYRTTATTGPAPVSGLAVAGADNSLTLVRNDWSATTRPVSGRASSVTRFADGP